MLTPSQQRALRTDVHLCVTANAGSGKTRVLVQRYLDLVAGPAAGVGNVVAITFTEKAASELRRKIAEGLQERLAAGPASDLRRRLEAVREDLPSAAIHTIHGFCSRLLREFPVEAGVDAAFGVIEPVDRSLLMEEALQGLFRSILREGGQGDLQEPLKDVVRAYGKKTVMRIAMALAARRELLERMLEPGGVLTRSDDMVLDLWQRTVEDHLFEALAGAGEDLDALLGAAEGGKADIARAALRRALQDRDRGERLRAALEFLHTALTKEGRVAKAVTGRGAPDIPRLSVIEKRLGPLRRVADLVLEGTMAQEHASLLRAMRTMTSLHRLAMERFESAKRDRALLDYDDLQLRVRALLGKEHIRRRLAERYRYIMVDEYQDTNRLQYDLLRPLVDDLRSGNLFIVGDPKQSIYGFRNAEVEVFRRTREDILRVAGAEGSVTLGESFRPLRALAAFVNILFSSVMAGRDAGPADVDYDQLVQARAEDDPGRVEVHVCDGSAGQGSVLARRISALVRDSARPVRYADIAILIRSRRLLPEIEEALVREGIPYLVSGGTGYFQTQDLHDFTNYLGFLLDPTDDVALAGILRSPFFAVSDAELFEAAGERRTGSLWHQLCDVPQCPSLARAVSMLAADLACAHRLPVPDLLERLVSQTGYEAVVAGLPRGEQSRANLRKLEDFVRRFDARGFTSLYDVVRRLRRLMEEEEQEGQGVIDATRDAVQVMTVHAAKGLEFPVVMVPGLERRFQYDRGLVLDEDLGMAFRPPEEIGEPPPIERILALRNRARSEAEEKRVFYVACTRARDMLVLAGAPVDPGGSPTWMGWLMRAFGWETAPDPGPVQRRVPLGVYRAGEAGGSPGQEEFLLDLHLLRPDPGSGAAPAAAADRPAGQLRLAVEGIPRPPRSEVYSATQLRTYVECPARYYLRYVLGIDPADEPFDGERADGLPARVRGSVIHAVLQRMERMEASAVSGLTRELLRAEGCTGAAAEREVDAVTALVEHVRASEIWGEVLDGTGVRTEFPVTASLGADYLTGTFDRIYKDRDGVPTVLDFKTDDIEPEEIPARADAYRTQVELYLFLAGKITGESRLRGILLFTRHPARPYRIEVGPAELAAIETRFHDIIARINSFNFKPLATPCPSCPWILEGCPAPRV